METLGLGDQSLQQLLITFTPILRKRAPNIKIKMRDSIQIVELILKPFTRIQEVGSLEHNSNSLLLEDSISNNNKCHNNNQGMY
jgi:hypothetical protein